MSGDKAYEPLHEEEGLQPPSSGPPSGAPQYNRSPSFMNAVRDAVSYVMAEQHPVQAARARSWVGSDNPARSSWNIMAELRGTELETTKEAPDEEDPDFDEEGGKKKKPGIERGLSLKAGYEQGGEFKRKHPFLYAISLRWWPGANIWTTLICVATGVLFKYMVPQPAELSNEAWNLLSVFIATILGLILEPLPTGGVAYIAMTVILAFGVLDFKTAFLSFTNDTIWLIGSAFFFAKGIEKTGLGERISNYFIVLFGWNSLGLAYALAFSETLIAAAMPSTTARAGGVFVPIIVNLAKHFGSHPRDPTARRLGAFLIMSQFQTSINASAMFLTGAAQNALCLTLAKDQGVVLQNEWMTWFKSAVLPASIGVLFSPLITFIIYPPKIKRTPNARGEAKEMIRDMGTASWDEWVMGFVLMLAVGLWIGGKYLPIPMSSTTTAFVAMSLLLLTGVLSWRDCITYAPAWDTIWWFAVLISMSSQLNNLGVIQYMADMISAPFMDSSLPSYAIFIIVQLAYFAIHYMFASQTAHVTALYPAFIAILLKLGFDPVLSTYSLAYTTNLFGSITHYAAGQAAVFYGSGYVSMQIILVIGFIFSVLNLSMWLGAGPLWFRIVGLYDELINPLVVAAPAPAP